MLIKKTPKKLFSGCKVFLEVIIFRIKTCALVKYQYELFIYFF